MINSYNSIREVVDHAFAIGIVRNENVIGCTESEIHSLEDDLGVKLPRTFRDFLTLAGRSFGDVMPGSAFLYSSIKESQIAMRAYLDECSGAKRDIPSDAFVVLHHQGYVFDFCLLRHVDDPLILSIGDGISGVVVMNWSFSQYLRDLVNYSARLITATDCRGFRVRHGLEPN